MSLAYIVSYQTITSISSRTRDQWGDFTTTSLYTNVPCRFVFDTTEIRKAQTEDQRVDAIAYIGPTYTSIAVDQQVVYDSNTYLISKVYREYDLFGNVDHYRLDLIAHGG